MCVLLVNMLNASPTYAEEETDAETQKLLERYEENLQEIEQLSKKKSDAEETEEMPTVKKSENEETEETSNVEENTGTEETEFFDPIEAEYLNQQKNKPKVLEEKIIEETPEMKFSFDWRGTSLARSIYGIAKVAGMGVVVNTEVTGTVYTSLKDVTCSEALEYLGRAFNFNYMIDKGNIIITKEDKMKQSRTFQIYYANKDKVVEELKALGIDSSKIYANKERGTISVTGTTWELREAEERLKKIDQPVSQCLHFFITFLPCQSSYSASFL